MDSPLNSISKPTRRSFIQSTSLGVGAVAAANTFAVPSVHAAEDNKIQVALIGCGGRGTGAATNALSVNNGPIQLVAAADVFPDRLSNSLTTLKDAMGDKVDVPADRRFVEFDAYKKAMDCLNPGDVAILTSPPAFRWVHFKYAIEKGLNVFMEKPVTVDGPSSRRMLELAKSSVEKNLKVGVGLMCRHCDVRRELFDRIKNDEIGEIVLMRAYRMAGPTGYAESFAKPEGISDLMYQIQRFHSFLWLSGGAFSDFLIHNIDECCWMKDAWPVSAIASGGRHYRNDAIDQNFDTYSVEYTFADGTKLDLDGRTIPGCHTEFASYAHGTKGLAVISSSGHSPANCKIYKGHKATAKNVVWEYGKQEANPYQLEWNHLIAAIRDDQPYNEVERGVMASVVTSMGRMAAHTGQAITFDDMLDCEHEFAPNIEQLTLESESPLKPDADGKYPVPQPGIVTTREYAEKTA